MEFVIFSSVAGIVERMTIGSARAAWREGSVKIREPLLPA